jgi:outer membrane receptor protein involved in Fe transport
MPSELYVGEIFEGGVYPQHQTMFDGYLGLASTNEDMPVQFAFSAGMKNFKMNHETKAMQSGSENNLYVRGDVWKSLNDGNRLGLDVKFDNYSYSLEQFAEADRAYDMDNAIAIDLNPYYSMENEQWRLRIGVNVDWWGGDEDKMFISPDVLAEYVLAERYVLYGQAVGGRKTNSFYNLSSQFSPYWVTDRLVSSYTSMDASVGLKGSPVNGMWFNLTGGYRITENDLSPYLMSDMRSSLVSFVQGKSKALYAGAELKYDYKDVWNMFLKGTYYNWSWDYPEDANLDKLGLQPEMEINGGVGVKVLEGVNVSLGYEYIKRCNQVYEPVNNLYMGATYDLFKNLQIYGKVNNLLNKDYVRADAYPAQGLNFLAGATFQF